MSAPARVMEILIAESPAHPMKSVGSAHLIAGLGIEGDRYALGKGTFSKVPQIPDGELTLVQLEHLEAFAQSSGLPFSAREARRNVVTVGVDLNALVGVEFEVGPVRLRGVRLCEPCSYLAKQTSPEVLRGLVHKGGLRAQILRGGTVTVDDPIRIPIEA